MNFIKSINGILGIICFSFLGYEGLSIVNRQLTTIKVYGLADIILESDRADFYITIKEEGNILKDIDAKLFSAKKKVIEFLKNEGYEKKEILDEGITIEDQYPSYYSYRRYDNDGNNKMPDNRYIVYSNISVCTDKVHKVRESISNITKLLGSGLFISTKVSYSCSDYEKIRLKLIKEATADSLKRAETIAATTKNKIVGLKNLSTSKFRILSGDKSASDDQSWSDGEHSFKKRFRMIVEANYNKE